jgi:AcrR family transcriptional regulator
MDGPDADDRQDTAGRAGAANGPGAAGQADAANGPGAANGPEAAGRTGAANGPEAGLADAANGPEAAGRPGAAGRGNPGERPNRNVARGEATRGQLVAIATRMFAERGYEDTSIEAVLREAGVSRGSLYHHFASKEVLFEAVAEEVETSVGAQTVAAASGSAGPVEALRAGFLAWIRLAGDPVVRRILLIDGPSVLGWERWRAMEERHALGLIRAVLQLIADEGKLRPESVATLANILLASVNEVALLVARSDDREAAMQAGADAIDELLQRLFTRPRA